MSYPKAPSLVLPLEPYAVTGRAFLEEAVFGGQSWGKHLGEDCLAESGTPVVAIGDGEVVYAALHASWLRRRGNWGHVVILGHAHVSGRGPFYSLYGHLGEFRVTIGHRVRGGEVIGAVGKGGTRANGYWPEPHLHFAIYQGPWEGNVLPGYFRKEDGRTRLEYWVPPAEFVRTYA